MGIEILTDDEFTTAYSDLPHGATFVKLGWNDHAEIVNVQGVGNGGMVLIDRGSAGLYGRGRELRAEWRSVMVTNGPFGNGTKITGMDRATARRALFVACWEHGTGKETNSSVVLAESDGECANCGEPIVWEPETDRNVGHWRHEEIDEDGQFIPCEGTGNAAPKAPKAYANGNDSWPNLLAADWFDYADGNDGIRRYLSNMFGISVTE